MTPAIDERLPPPETYPHKRFLEIVKQDQVEQNRNECTPIKDGDQRPRHCRMGTAVALLCIVVCGIFMVALHKKESGHQLRTEPEPNLISTKRVNYAMCKARSKTFLKFLIIPEHEHTASDHCTVNSTKGGVTVMICQSSLHALAPGREPIMVSDQAEHQAVTCTSTGNNPILYSTVCRESQIMIVEYSLTGRGTLVKEDETPILGARESTSISVASKTKNLAVVDSLYPRVTIHSPNCTQIQVIEAIQRKERILCQPLHAVWSLCERHLYVIDAGSNSGCAQSVVKLTLDNPVTVQWRRMLYDQYERIKLIEGRLYLYGARSFINSCRVLSEKDGTTARRPIECSGAVQDVKHSPDGIELVYGK